MWLQRFKYRTVSAAVIPVLMLAFVGLVSGACAYTVGRGEADAWEARAISAEASATVALQAEVNAIVDAAELRQKLAHAHVIMAAHDSQVASLTTQVATLTKTVTPKVARKPVKPAQKSTAVKRVAPAPKTTTGGGAERWRSLVARYFPANAVDEALYIISRESGGNPANNNGDCKGLFQIAASVHFHHYPNVDGTTAEGNVYIASRLYANSGGFDKHWYDHTAYPRYRP